MTPDASSAHLARYEGYSDIIFQISCFGGPSPASVGIRQHIGRVPGHVPHTVRPLTTGTKQCSTDRIRNRTPGSSGQSPGVAIPGLRRPRWPVARLPPRLRPTCARTSTAPGVSVVRDAQFVVHVARLGGTSHRAGAASSKRPAFVKFSPKFSFFFYVRGLHLGSQIPNTSIPTARRLTALAAREGETRRRRTPITLRD